jgi:outer membrane protein assembly factor BamE
VRLVSIKVLFLFPVLIFFMGLLGCQTNPKRQFEKISNGMEKNNVLHLMGPPTTSLRFSGKDRWIYRFYENDERFVKEIHFLDGKAVYVGDEYQAPPEQQALFIDSVNEKRDREIAEAELKHKVDLEQSYNQYQQKSKLDDRVRYLPKFEPIR